MHWNVVGHEWAVNILRVHVARGQPKHAYLFCGPEGVGKRTLALRFAQALNCQQPPEAGLMCGSCRACRLIEEMHHPDLFVVEAEQWRGVLKVDQVRELSRSLALAPYEARFRIALLLRFQEANPSAMNALLKTLEEPNPQVVLLLTSESPEDLLPTIVSRCEVIRLTSIPRDEIRMALSQHWRVDAERAELLASISNGRMGYALRLHRSPELFAERRQYLEQLWHLLHADRYQRFRYAEKLSHQKTNLRQAILYWQSFFHDVFLRCSRASVKIANIDFSSEVDALAAQMNLERASKLLAELQRALALIDRNVNPRLTLEVLFLEMPYLNSSP